MPWVGISPFIDLNTNRAVFNLHISSNFNNFNFLNKGEKVCILSFFKISRVSFLWQTLIDWSFEVAQDAHKMLQYCKYGKQIDKYISLATYLEIFFLI